MKKESSFLRRLVGKPVRIAVVNEASLPPLRTLILQEISDLGVVASDSKTAHFFPWSQIVEITPVKAHKR